MGPPLWTVAVKITGSEPHVMKSKSPKGKARGRSSPTRSRATSESWSTSVENDCVRLSHSVNGQTTDQLYSGYDMVFREEVSEPLVFEKVFEPLLLDVWNGGKCTLLQSGQPQHYEEEIGPSLDWLFNRISDATHVSASVLRFKVFLHVVDVFTEGPVDALDHDKILHIGVEGSLSPTPLGVELFSARDGIERLSSLRKPYVGTTGLRKSSATTRMAREVSSTRKAASPRHGSKRESVDKGNGTATGNAFHRVIWIRMERWVRKRNAGLLAIAGDSLRSMRLSSQVGSSGALRASELAPSSGAARGVEEDTLAWSITESELKFVRIGMHGTRLDNRNRSLGSSLSSHGNAHRHRLSKDTAKVLTALCRCLREPGGGYRDSKLTHLLKTSFTQHTRCTLLVRIAAVGVDYSLCAGPIRFCDRVVQALRNQDELEIVVSDELESDSCGEQDGLREVSTFEFPRRSSPRNQDRDKRRLLVDQWLEGLRGEIETHDSSDFSSKDELAESDLLQHSKGPAVTNPRQPPSAAGDTELSQSRQALREQLTKIQVNRDLLKSKHVEKLNSNKATANAKRLEETDEVIESLESERKESMDKNRQLMQQVWELEGERTELLQKVRKAEAEVVASQTECAAKDKEVKMLRKRLKDTEATLKAEHIREMEQVEAKLMEETSALRAELLAKVSTLEEEKSKLSKRLKDKAKEKAAKWEESYMREVEERQKQAADREMKLRERITKLQEEKRGLVEEHSIAIIERDRRLRSLEDMVENLQADKDLASEKFKLELQSVRVQAKQQHQEDMEATKQLELELQLAKRVHAEKERATVAGAETSQRRIDKLNEELFATTKALNERTAEVDTLRKEVGRLKALERERDTQVYKRREDETSAHHSQALDEIEEKDAQIVRLMSACEELSDAHGAVCADLEVAHEEISVLKERISALEAALAQEKEDYQALLAEFRDARASDRAALVRKVDSEPSHLELLQAKVELLTKELQSVKQQQRQASSQPTQAREQENLSSAVEKAAEKALERVSGELRASFMQGRSNRDARRQRSGHKARRHRLEDEEESEIDVFSSGSRSEEEQDFEDLSYKSRLSMYDGARNAINESLARTLRERDLEVAMLQKQLDSLSAKKKNRQRSRRRYQY